MKVFNYEPINEYVEGNKVTIELDNELLYKMEKFFTDVLKEEKFVPYDIINGYEEATDDSFYFEYETDTNLAPANYLLLDISEVTKEGFFKFLEYENTPNEKHLKELNEYILETKEEIMKQFPNVEIFKGYENENLLKDNRTMPEVKYDLFKEKIFKKEILNLIESELEEKDNKYVGNIKETLNNESLNKKMEEEIYDLMQKNVSNYLTAQEVVIVGEYDLAGVDLKDEERVIDSAFEISDNLFVADGIKIYNELKEKIEENIKYNDVGEEYIKKVDINAMYDEMNFNIEKAEKRIVENKYEVFIAENKKEMLELYQNFTLKSEDKVIFFEEVFNNEKFDEKLNELMVKNLENINLTNKELIELKNADLPEFKVFSKNKEIYTNNDDKIFNEKDVYDSKIELEGIILEQKGDKKGFEIISNLDWDNPESIFKLDLKDITIKYLDKDDMYSKKTWYDYTNEDDYIKRTANRILNDEITDELKLEQVSMKKDIERMLKYVSVDGEDYINKKDWDNYKINIEVDAEVKKNELEKRLKSEEKTKKELEEFDFK